MANIRFYKTRQQTDGDLVMAKKPPYEALLKKLHEYEEIVRDLGKLKETEEALQVSEKKYRRLVESLERDYIITAMMRTATLPTSALRWKMCWAIPGKSSWGITASI